MGKGVYSIFILFTVVSDRSSTVQDYLGNLRENRDESLGSSMKKYEL